MNDIDFEPFLALRRHLKIAHHIPGRIRLRVDVGALHALGRVDGRLFDEVLGAIAGIDGVRLNALAGSVTIGYAPELIDARWWEILVHGEDQDATRLLQRLLDGELASALAVARDQ